MAIPLLQVDAFTSRKYCGNPAGVCLLDGPADPAWMQAVAAEMNVAETAFLVQRGEAAFDLRWFMPTVEVRLCGHATLAAAPGSEEWSTAAALGAALGDMIILTAPAAAMAAESAAGWDTAGTDFVSRCFVPAWGIPEDPVTGSAHCALARSGRLGWAGRR